MFINFLAVTPPLPPPQSFSVVKQGKHTGEYVEHGDHDRRAQLGPSALCGLLFAVRVRVLSSERACTGRCAVHSRHRVPHV